MVCLLLLGLGWGVYAPNAHAYVAISEDWSDEVCVPSVEDETVVTLSRADGVAIRSALIASLRSRSVRVLPSDLRARVRRRRVGALWMDQGRPRIGSFWVQHRSDGSLELSDTLVMNDHVRFGLVVRVAKRGRRWVVTHLSSLISHTDPWTPSRA